MSSTDAEVMSTEPSAQSMVMKTSEDAKSSDSGTAIQSSGDAPPATNGESVEKSDSKDEASAPIEVSMEEEPKEDFDSVSSEVKHDETNEVVSEVKEGTSATDVVREDDAKANEVEISKEDLTSKPTEKSEHGGWKLLSDQKKQEEPSVEPVVEDEAEKMEVSNCGDEDTKECKAPEVEKIDDVAISGSSEKEKPREKVKDVMDEEKVHSTEGGIEVTKPDESETVKHDIESTPVTESSKEMDIADEPKCTVVEQVQNTSANEAVEEVKISSESDVSKEESKEGETDEKCAEKNLNDSKTDGEEKMEVDEVKDDVVKETAPKVAEEITQKETEKENPVEKEEHKTEESECVASEGIVGGENTSSVDKEKNEVKSVENEKPVETQKVEENNNPVVDTEKAVEDAEKSAGEGERSEEVKSSSSGGRGRGRGRGRGGRNSSRSSGVKPQPEVSTEGIANTRPRRSTRSTVDYANPDVATLQQKVTRGRGRGRGRGGHRGGKRGADDDDDGEDSGSEYGPSKRKRARGSTSARGRGRGRGRGGRSRSARGKKKDKEENDSDDDEEEMDLGDDDAPSDGSAEESYKPSKRRSDASQSLKSSPKKKGRRAACAKAADED